MTIAEKKFKQRYEPIADVISRADIAQVDREKLATAMGDALRAIARGRGDTDFLHDAFVLIASDPLVKCAGYDDPEGAGHVDCPDDIEIRVGMHLSSAPDGRSQAWRPRLPVRRCARCGAVQFMKLPQRP